MIIFGKGGGRAAGRDFRWPILGQGGRFQYLKAPSFLPGTKGLGEISTIFVSVKKPSPPPPYQTKAFTEES